MSKWNDIRKYYDSIPGSHVQSNSVKSGTRAGTGACYPIRNIYLNDYHFPQHPISRTLAQVSETCQVGTSGLNTRNTTQQWEGANTLGQIAQDTCPLLGLYDDPSNNPARMVFKLPAHQAEPGSGVP